MKILVFCETAAAGKGGMEKTAINLANHLSKVNDCTLGYFYNGDRSEPSYKLGADVGVLRREIGGQSLKTYFDAVANRDFDVCVYFSTGSNILKFLKYYKDLRVPLVIHEGSNPDRVVLNNWKGPDGMTKYEALWQREYAYSFASAVRFTMDIYRESLASFMQSRVFSFPNAFSLSEVSSSCLHKRIINIGGLKKNKNIIPLLDACAVVFREHSDWTLDVYSSAIDNPGAMAYREYVRQLIKAHGIEGNVRIMDEVDNIYDEFICSGFHVITSLSEGLSNSVCEAMCCGVPTIGIKGVPGVDGLIDDGVNGMLVNSDDIVGELVSIMRNLIINEQLRSQLGRNSREKAKSFDPEIIYASWDKIIDYAVFGSGRCVTDEASLHYSRSFYL